MAILRKTSPRKEWISFTFPIGTEIRIGNSVVLRVTQIGKVCHDRCAIYYQAGDCIMPKEGIFAEVIQEGDVKVGDEIINRMILDITELCNASNISRVKKCPMARPTRMIPSSSAVIRIANHGV